MIKNNGKYRKSNDIENKKQQQTNTTHKPTHKKQKGRTDKHIAASHQRKHNIMNNTTKTEEEQRQGNRTSKHNKTLNRKESRYRTCKTPEEIISF